MSALEPVADGVYVLRYPVLDVNATVVLGDRYALVVDTLSSDAQAGTLLAALRAVTALPLILVNTHFHFDHCLGNAVLAAGGRPIWAHTNAAAQLRERGGYWQRRWYGQWLAAEPDLARDLAATRLVPPDRTVGPQAAVDLGGREVLLRHHGRGHTDGDLVVRVPDAGVLLAGDLVEQGGPPDFADGYPLAWPETLASVLREGPGDRVVVPGHGAVVDRDFVTAQHADLAALDWLIRQGDADGAPAQAVADAAAARTGFPAATTLVAVRRGYAELAGRL